MLLFLPGFGVFLVSGVHGSDLRNLGDGHIPPRFVTGYSLAVVGFHNNDGCSWLLASFDERHFQFFASFRSGRISTQASGIGDEVNFDYFAAKPAFIPIAILRSHAGVPARSG